VDSARRPIGIFDSGVGGLSVAREIRRMLPADDLLYVADTAYCPYGDRPLPEVRSRALAVGSFLERSGARLLVVACNTASGAALEELRQAVSVPVVGLEPAVKTGAALTRNRRVGVMATAGTLASARYARLVRDHGSGIEIVPQPCPGLADLVEEGHFDSERLLARLEQLTLPLKRAAVDTVVLGCTHYAFVREPLARVLGPEVRIVDSAPAIARRTQSLSPRDAFGTDDGPGRLTVLTTGDPDRVAPVVARLWGGVVPIGAAEIPGP
jgi:glutamate racemase